MNCTECTKYQEELKRLLQNCNSIFDTVLDMELFTESCDRSMCSKESSERIFCAAIKYKPEGYPGFLIMRGLSHEMCVEFLNNAGLTTDKRDLDVEEYGFITDKGRFVSREKAFCIAKDAGQLIKSCHSNKLFSDYCKYDINTRV